MWRAQSTCILLLFQCSVCPCHCRRRRPNEYKIMQRLRRILSTLTLISICRFVSPNSPSRHYTISCILMHSHFFTKSLLTARRRCWARSVGNTVAISARFPRRKRTRAMETMFYTFYCQESVETMKKMDAPGDFFFLSIRWISLPLSFQQEALRPSEGVVGWERRKVKKKFFYFKLLLLDMPIWALHLHCSACVCACVTGREAAPPPITSPSH